MCKARHSYQCEICSKAYGTLAHLNRHKKNIHDPFAVQVSPKLDFSPPCLIIYTPTRHQTIFCMLRPQLHIQNEPEIQPRPSRPLTVSPVLLASTRPSKTADAMAKSPLPQLE
ncbi:hypothetical protein BOTBODRAFT_39614 [Botryobasidium botryosum FD-172 SS1]|uniref:C2H2-type domain-containing protein n=1 Tax=Botryobasidium botryosum (strain FD-172 SS1) TaxID=930990 RepID=A0A067M3H9_BOTB1|nr:hypothetical protein BOTBODRAFT_39614 [Botryobasidium botryosum FD-172 SS1]